MNDIFLFKLSMILVCVQCLYTIFCFQLVIELMPFQGNNLSSAKVEFEKIETNTTRETTLPSCKDLSTSESQLSDRQNSMLKKRCQTKEVVKGPKRTKQEKVKNFQCGQVNKQPLCTPTKLYVDECVFCHTFRTTEVITILQMLYFTSLVELDTICVLYYVADLLSRELSS